MAHRHVPEVPLTERACLSVGEAAALAGLSVSFLYILIGRGALRSVKLGGRRLIPRGALQELITHRERPQVSDCCDGIGTAAGRRIKQEEGAS